MVSEKVFGCINVTNVWNGRMLRYLKKLFVFSLGWNRKHLPLIDIFVLNFLPICFYIIFDVLHSNLFVVLRLQISKTFFFQFLHINAQFLVSAWSAVDIFISNVFRSKWPIFDLHIKHGYRQIIRKNKHFFWKSEKMDQIILHIRLPCMHWKLGLGTVF